MSDSSESEESDPLLMHGSLDLAIKLLRRKTRSSGDCYHEAADTLKLLRDEYRVDRIVDRICGWLLAAMEAAECHGVADWELEVFESLLCISCEAGDIDIVVTISLSDEGIGAAISPAVRPEATKYPTEFHRGNMGDIYNERALGIGVLVHVNCAVMDAVTQDPPIIGDAWLTELVMEKLDVISVAGVRKRGRKRRRKKGIL